MPAKRTPKKNDLQADFASHLKASEEAYGWAERAVKLRQAGKEKAAQAAERKAKQCLRQVVDLEKRYPPIARERHMIKD